jgi:CheY-like chemotaxis protein
MIVNLAPPVLIVEDHADTREMVETLVRSEGYRVSTAAHGAEALESVAREAPCLILLDISMPVMDGPTFARRLRALPNPVIARTPIVVLTAIPHADRILEDIGAVEFLRKPVTLSNILEACARYCPPTAKAR